MLGSQQLLHLHPVASPVRVCVQIASGIRCSILDRAPESRPSHKTPGLAVPSSNYGQEHAWGGLQGKGPWSLLWVRWGRKGGSWASREQSLGPGDPQRAEHLAHTHCVMRVGKQLGLWPGFFHLWSEERWDPFSEASLEPVRLCGSRRLGSVAREGGSSQERGGGWRWHLHPCPHGRAPGTSSLFPWHRRERVPDPPTGSRHPHPAGRFLIHGQGTAYPGCQGSGAGS